MKISRACSIGFASTFTLALIACGGADDSTFNNGGSGGNPNDGTGSSGNPNAGGVNFGADAGGGVDSKCAQSTAQAQLVPVNLVFMVDRSGSMSENSKWPTIVQGLDTFFADPKSSGMSASIAFFKVDSNECSPAAYATPSVSMTALPAASFKSTIAGYSPNGGTPTLPALEGAIQYAKTVAQSKVGEKVAVVLATDGIPNDCNSNVQNVTAAAAGAASTIPTYVIGVGDQLQSLDTIAAGGGTSKAFVVAVGDPAKTATDFQNALNVIRGKTLSCEFKLPTPPAGKTLDINNVNVVYTPGNAAGGTLTYNKDCTGGAGWHYDDANAPAKIILCQGTCGTVQADQAGKIDIVTGCATKGGVVR